MELVKKIVNRLLKVFQISHGPDDGKTVYLTFDDGPEPGITEFVLDELDKFGFKATFFCKGDNAVKYPELQKMIIERGHAIGNHTYSHIHSFRVKASEYVNDVHMADAVLNGTILFRPPWGSLTLSTFLRLKDKYKFIYWSQASGDTELEKFDLNRNRVSLEQNTKAGDIVLFHFCHRHEKETRQILPVYLRWLSGEGYTSKCL